MSSSGPAGWKVTYLRKRAAFVVHPGNTEKAKERLAAVLREVANSVGGDARLSSSSDMFRNAAGALSAPDPVAPHYPDILPARGYSLPCRQLMAASVGGYAGMASWNGAGPASQTEQPKFQALFKELFIAALEGLATAVNSKIDP